MESIEAAHTRVCETLMAQRGYLEALGQILITREAEAMDIASRRNLPYGTTSKETQTKHYSNDV